MGDVKSYEARLQDALIEWRRWASALNNDPMGSDEELRGAIGRRVAPRRSAVARRPIERYVRAAVAIPGSKGRADGTIEIGLHYDPSGDQPGRLRDSLLRCGDLAVRSTDGEHLDENIADAITANLDQRIVDIWGDRPRFIEVWRGTGDDAEPLTQVYAPHGMPIGRTT